jgi:hypothetical protein
VARAQLGVGHFFSGIAFLVEEACANGRAHTPFVAATGCIVQSLASFHSSARRRRIIVLLLMLVSRADVCYTYVMVMRLRGGCSLPRLARGGLESSSEEAGSHGGYNFFEVRGSG